MMRVSNSIPWFIICTVAGPEQKTKAFGSQLMSMQPFKRE